MLVRPLQDASCPLQNASPRMYITGAPTIGCESRDVYRWCAHYRMRVQECISLVRPLQDVSPRMYIAGAPTVECMQESTFCEIICLTYTYITCLGKVLVHLYCHLFMGSPLTSEFLDVLQIMSRRASSKGDRGKAPMYATSQGGDSSDDETISASEQVTQVLQSRFGRGEEDTGSPTAYLLRPGLGDDISLRWPVLHLSFVPFLARQLHGIGQLEGGEPPEERCEMMTSLQTQMRPLLGPRSYWSLGLGGIV